MATINFFIQTKSNPSGIYIRLKDGRTVDAKAKTPYVIDPNIWSATKGQPKYLKDEATKRLNKDLQTLRLDILNQYNADIKNLTINTQWLKKFLSSIDLNNDIPQKLIDYFDYYATHKKSAIASSTHAKLMVNKHLLQRFQQHMKTTFFIRDVNADFKLQFENYCRKENYSANTIARALKYIKTICYHATNNGIETHFQLKAIKARMEKVEKIYLNKHEIDLIEKADIKAEHLLNARDWLIISCETGQRVSDFMRFQTDQIRFEQEVPLIEFTQVKTGKIMAIPLSKKVRSILNKRDGNFPRKISDQRYNEYIKEVCRIAGLTEKIAGSKINSDIGRKQKGLFPKFELITSHIGRKSFATNNYGRIPTSLLINVTGHSTESMFLEYIGKTNTEKAKQLAEYF